MKGISIADTTEDGHFLNFDLKDVLSVLDELITTSYWSCKNVECVGVGTEQLQALSNTKHTKQQIDTAELRKIAEIISQTIEGDFEAYRLEGSDPWLIVSAVDSSCFDVWSNDQVVFEMLKNHFHEVTDLPEKRLESSSNESREIVEKSNSLKSNSPYTYRWDIRLNEPCPYCGTTIKIIGGWGARGCPDRECDFWKYHQDDFKELETDHILNVIDDIVDDINQDLTR